MGFDIILSLILPLKSAKQKMDWYFFPFNIAVTQSQIPAMFLLAVPGIPHWLWTIYEVHLIGTVHVLVVYSGILLERLWTSNFENRWTIKCSRKFLPTYCALNYNEYCTNSASIHVHKYPHHISTSGFPHNEVSAALLPVSKNAGDVMIKR